MYKIIQLKFGDLEIHNKDNNIITVHVDVILTCMHALESIAIEI